MAALWNRAGHYILQLWFLSFFFFSSPNLRGQRLVYHTSTHDVALVRISNAYLKCAACGLLKIQNAKITPSVHHRTTSTGYIFTTKAHNDNGEKLVKQQYVLHISLQYGELGPLAAEILSLVWGTPTNFNGFRVLAALLHGI